MKKVKVLLAAIVLISGVGGTLAFKANKFSNGNIYCNSSCLSDRKVKFTTAASGVTTVCASDGSGMYFSTAGGCSTVTTTTASQIQP